MTYIRAYICSYDRCTHAPQVPCKRHSDYIASDDAKGKLYILMGYVIHCRDNQVQDKFNLCI